MTEHTVTGTPAEPAAATATDHLRTEVKHLLNRHSRENESNTPDHILADVMMSALLAFEEASKRREQWYGKALLINPDDAPWVESPRGIGSTVGRACCPDATPAVGDEPSPE